MILNIHQYCPGKPPTNFESNKFAFDLKKNDIDLVRIRNTEILGHSDADRQTVQEALSVNIEISFSFNFLKRTADWAEGF